jgi:hypothetical protein
VNVFGFQNEDFIILKDAEATHTGIENAFKQLINQVKKAEKAQEGDFVYIYYSRAWFTNTRFKR